MNAERYYRSIFRPSVRLALPGSWEEPLRDVAREDTSVFGDEPEVAPGRLQRAIGVVYLPRSERASHYFEARPADQFDVLVRVDESRALEPLEKTSGWETGEPAEMYPSAL